MKPLLLSIVFASLATVVYGESLAPELKLHVDSFPAALVGNLPITLLDDRPQAETDFSVMPAVEVTDVKKGLTTVKPYKFMDDMTFVGVPLFVAGIIAKSEKRSFRQDYNNTSSRTRLIKYNFHNELDNYSQFAPMVLATGLNLAGVEGRSSFGRYLASGLMSYAIMAAIVNPIKYTAKEMRPDGSTRNSWPSGHTATAFVSATILHKEYGLTRSPWYSVAGYGIATATGVMRVLNNRHWVSDVLSGAGIGIFSTELAYGLSDLIFKGHGLKRNDLTNTHNIIDNPSFFSISMGIGLGSKNLDFSDIEVENEDGTTSPLSLNFGSATVVGAEGAYFLNKYVGIGGRLRVRSNPVKGWNDISNLVIGSMEEFQDELKDDEDLNALMSGWTTTIESDHITEFTGDVGVYFNFPLSTRFAVGSKLLVGRSIIQDLDLNAKVSGEAIGTYNKSNNQELSVITDDMDEDDVDFKSKGTTYDEEWDLMTVSGNNTMKVGTGISLTYAYKSSFSWKVFIDYDYTRKTYTFDYDPCRFIRTGCPALYNSDEDLQPISSTTKKHLNHWVLGGAFCISF